MSQNSSFPPSSSIPAAPGPLLVSPADALSVDVHELNGHTVVSVSGELDVATSPQLREALREVASTGVTDTVVDLEAVTFIDSTALGVLVTAQRSAAESGGSLTLICHDPRCLRPMEITGLTRVFTFAPSVAAATGT